ncbi:MAG: hypothetical protein IJ305_04765, partial [Oscillospiraceae bacterium]|nr:hypothetical protein [Oscillospiraceae bacterium]
CAKAINDTFTKAGSFFTNYYENEFCEDYFEENDIEYVNYDLGYGMTFNYNMNIIFNNIVLSAKSYDRMTQSAWDYVGFYYDSESLFWTIIYIDTDSVSSSKSENNVADEKSSTSSIPFDNSTPYETLNTYLRSLVFDDYETYLAITLENDNEETRESFDYRKEGYVGVSMGDIKVYETELNPLYGYSDTDYKVIEFTDDGSYKFDLNTFDDAYGVVRIDESSFGGYYVWGHVRYSPYYSIN